MKKYLLMLMGMAISLPCLADITVKFPEEYDLTKLMLQEGYISDMAVKGKKGAEIVAVAQDSTGAIWISELPEKAAQYTLYFGDDSNLTIWAAPGENINIEVENTNPLQYKVTGSRLMDDYSVLNGNINEIINRYSAELKQPEANAEAIKKLQNELHVAIHSFLNTHPDSPVAPLAVLELSDNAEDFLNAYSELTPTAKESILMPYLEVTKAYVERNLGYERKMAQLQSGNMDAPGFTFEDRAGKPVSLSDFKGKWVIIDFWGSWCRWCIKGFPSLKEAYAKYKPELEIIGVACNDTPDAWVKAIDKYNLDWVNLYNPAQGGGPLLEEYAVQGFPTKVIVDPEGKIRNITAGDDPAFYEVLESLISKDVKK